MAVWSYLSWFKVALIIKFSMSVGGNNPFDKFVRPEMQQKGNSTANLFANQPVATNVAGNNPPSQSNQTNFFASSSTTQQVNQIQKSKPAEHMSEEYYKEAAE